MTGAPLNYLVWSAKKWEYLHLNGEVKKTIRRVWVALLFE